VVDDIDNVATVVSKAAADYALAVQDSSATLLRITSNQLSSNIDMLRSDLQVAADPAFIASATRILEIDKNYGCQSWLASSREFRDLVEALRLRLDELALPVDAKIRIQNNINSTRGHFAEILLSCQDLERARTAASESYGAVDTAMSALITKVDK
jgi:hypothetical protein